MIRIILIFLLSITNVIAAVDYTARQYHVNTCNLFAAKARAVSHLLSNNISLNNLLTHIEHLRITDSTKERLFQAIQFVWANQIDNPHLAYTLAMGTCIQPITPLHTRGFRQLRDPL